MLRLVLPRGPRSSPGPSPRVRASLVGLTGPYLGRWYGWYLPAHPGAHGGDLAVFAGVGMGMGMGMVMDMDIGVGTDMPTDTGVGTADRSALASPGVPRIARRGVSLCCIPIPDPDARAPHVGGVPGKETASRGTGVRTVPA